MVIIITLLFVGILTFVGWNIVDYLTSNKFSPIKKYLIWQKFYKVMKNELTHKKFDMSKRSMIMWEKTEFGDYQIRVHLVDKTRRSSKKLEPVVDDRGFLVPDVRENKRFIEYLERKSRP